MKPTNITEQGCDPISSNCIIWQGPDLDCIGLCKGDTVSDVVYKLATELCNITAGLDISTYDLSCFNLGECGPKDFADLQQFLIGKVCEANNISPSGGESSAGCPDCVVPICSEFQYTDPKGDIVTTMQLDTYVQAIGNRVCGLVGSINTINSTLANHAGRIETLENNQSEDIELPVFSPVCVSEESQVSLSEMVAFIEGELCALKNGTGDATELLAAVNAACAGLVNSDKLGGSGTWAADTSFINAPSNLAESFNNVWKVVCDLRTAVQSIQTNCCDTGCSAIDLDLGLSLPSTSEIVILYNGSIPNNYADNVLGSSLQLTDSNGGTQTLNGIQLIQNYFSSGSSQSITLNGVDGALDITAKLTYRFIDPVTQATCENIVQAIVLGADSCPDLTLVPDYTTLSYSFNWNGTTPKLITVELYDATGTVLVQSTVSNITGNNPNGSFVGLTEGTDYQIRLVIDNTPCEFETFTTLAYPCTAPTLNAPTIDYTAPEGSITSQTIEGWTVDYNNVYNLA